MRACSTGVAGIAAIGLLLAACGGQRDVLIEDAWVRSAPAGAAVLAAYCTIRNRRDAPAVVVGARSPAFEGVELHETTIADGVSRMRRIDRLTVPAGGHVEFRPGGRHLMLKGPRRLLAPGDRIEIALELEDGARAVAEFEVATAGAEANP
ncbi:copper chaperone PCu(A)C [soil metagenome]